MKRVVSAVVICLFVAVALFLFFRPERTVSPGNPLRVWEVPSESVGSRQTNSNPGVSTNVPATSLTRPASSATTSPSSQDLSSRAGENVADATTAVPNLPPDIMLQNVRRAIRQYGGMFGGNPVGTNPEITAALAGSNPKGINFLRGQPGLRVNDKGEMVDAWGTPYFFHQLSGTEMEIHSAGPDKVMWTSDDLVMK